MSEHQPVVSGQMLIQRPGTGNVPVTSLLQVARGAGIGGVASTKQVAFVDKTDVNEPVGAKGNLDVLVDATTETLQRTQSRPTSKHQHEVMDIVETQQDDNPSNQIGENQEQENHGHAAYLSQDLDGDTQLQMTDQTILADGSVPTQALGMHQGVSSLMTSIHQRSQRSIYTGAHSKMSSTLTASNARGSYVDGVGLVGAMISSRPAHFVPHRGTQTNTLHTTFNKEVPQKQQKQLFQITDKKAQQRQQQAEASFAAAVRGLNQRSKLSNNVAFGLRTQPKQDTQVEPAQPATVPTARGNDGIKESARAKAPQQHETKRGIKMSKLDLRTVRQESVQPETMRDQDQGATGNVTPMLSERPLKGASTLKGMHTKSKPSFQNGPVSQLTASMTKSSSQMHQRSLAETLATKPGSAGDKLAVTFNSSQARLAALLQNVPSNAQAGGNQVRTRAANRSLQYFSQMSNQKMPGQMVGQKPNMVTMQKKRTEKIASSTGPSFAMSRRAARESTSTVQSFQPYHGQSQVISSVRTVPGTEQRPRGGKEERRKAMQQEKYLKNVNLLQQTLQTAPEFSGLQVPARNARASNSHKNYGSKSLGDARVLMSSATLNNVAVAPSEGDMGQVTPPAMPSISVKDELDNVGVETIKRQVLHCDLTLDRIKEDARQLDNKGTEAVNSLQDYNIVHTKKASMTNWSLGGAMKDRPGSAVIGEEKSVACTTVEAAKAETASYVSVSSIMKPQVSAFRSIDSRQRAQKHIPKQTPLREDYDEVRIEESGPMVTFEESPPRQELLNTYGAGDQRLNGIGSGQHALMTLIQDSEGINTNHPMHPMGKVVVPKLRYTQSEANLGTQQPKVNVQDGAVNISLNLLPSQTAHIFQSTQEMSMKNYGHPSMLLIPENPNDMQDLQYNPLTVSSMASRILMVGEGNFMNQSAAFIRTGSALQSQQISPANHSTDNHLKGQSGTISQSSQKQREKPGQVPTAVLMRDRFQHGAALRVKGVRYAPPQQAQKRKQNNSFASVYQNSSMRGAGARSTQKTDKSTSDVKKSHESINNSVNEGRRDAQVSRSQKLKAATSSSASHKGPLLTHRRQEMKVLNQQQKPSLRLLGIRGTNMLHRETQQQISAPKLFQERRRGQHPPKLDAYSQLESIKNSSTDLAKKGKGLKKLEKDIEESKQQNPEKKQLIVTHNRSPNDSQVMNSSDYEFRIAMPRENRAEPAKLPDEENDDDEVEDQGPLDSTGGPRSGIHTLRGGRQSAECTITGETARADLNSQTNDPGTQRDAPKSPKFVQINLRMYNNFLAAPRTSEGPPVLVTTQTMPDFSPLKPAEADKDTDEMVQAALTQSKPLLEQILAEQDRQLSLDIETTRKSFQEKRQANEEVKAAIRKAQKARMMPKELKEQQRLRQLTEELRLDERHVRQSSSSPSVRASRYIQDQIQATIEKMTLQLGVEHLSLNQDIVVQPGSRNQLRRTVSPQTQLRQPEQQADRQQDESDSDHDVLEGLNASKSFLPETKIGSEQRMNVDDTVSLETSKEANLMRDDLIKSSQIEIAARNTSTVNSMNQSRQHFDHLKENYQDVSAKISQLVAEREKRNKPSPNQDAACSFHLQQIKALRVKQPSPLVEGTLPERSKTPNLLRNRDLSKSHRQKNGDDGVDDSGNGHLNLIAMLHKKTNFLGTLGKLQPHAAAQAKKNALAYSDVPLNMTEQGAQNCNPLVRSISALTIQRTPQIPIKKTQQQPIVQKDSSRVYQHILPPTKNEDVQTSLVSVPAALTSDRDRRSALFTVYDARNEDLLDYDVLNILDVEKLEQRFALQQRALRMSGQARGEQESPLISPGREDRSSGILAPISATRHQEGLRIAGVYNMIEKVRANLTTMQDMNARLQRDQMLASTPTPSQSNRSETSSMMLLQYRVSQATHGKAASALGSGTGGGTHRRRHVTGSNPFGAGTEGSLQIVESGQSASVLSRDPASDLDAAMAAQSARLRRLGGSGNVKRRRVESFLHGQSLERSERMLSQSELLQQQQPQQHTHRVQCKEPGAGLEVEQTNESEEQILEFRPSQSQSATFTKLSQSLAALQKDKEFMQAHQANLMSGGHGMFDSGLASHVGLEEVKDVSEQISHIEVIPVDIKAATEDKNDDELTERQGLVSKFGTNNSPFKYSVR